MSVLVTGAGGFIGSYVSEALCRRGETVVGIDNLNDYYDVSLKHDRLEQLASFDNFKFAQIDISDADALNTFGKDLGIDRIVHLAAQAGVRYSIENPGVYVRSNLIGHSNMLEFARQKKVINMVYASSSSIYGGNVSVPFAEDDKTDDPVSFYGATKKSNELLSHSYARLYNISLTGLRFFTVYGPKGRPDMAYWIFSEKLRNGLPIDVFNYGKMGRDFTYITDIVAGVLAALDRPASTLSIPVPHRVYNLGNDNPESLMDLIEYIEGAFGKVFEKNFKPMQAGDVQQTWANIDRAKQELDYQPRIELKTGIENFAIWYEDYCAKK